MNRTRLWRQVPLWVTAVMFCATTGLASQWLRTAVDPTCAVIEKAEYDASRKQVRITGRSAETVTLRIYERETHDALIVARRPEAGKWSVEFDLVGADATPGMVVVQGTSGCVALRMVTDESFSQGPRIRTETVVAASSTGSAGIVVGAPLGKERR